MQLASMPYILADWKSFSHIIGFLHSWWKWLPICILTGLSACRYVSSLCSRWLDLILSPRSISEGNSDRLLPPAPALAHALHAERLEVTKRRARLALSQVAGI